MSVLVSFKAPAANATVLPYQDPANSGELLKVLAGAPPYSDFWSGLVAGGDGASITAYMNAASDAGVRPSIGTIMGEVESLNLTGGSKLVSVAVTLGAAADAVTLVQAYQLIFEGLASAYASPTPSATFGTPTWQAVSPGGWLSPWRLSQAVVWSGGYIPQAYWLWHDGHYGYSTDPMPDPTICGAGQAAEFACEFYTPAEPEATRAAETAVATALWTEMNALTVGTWEVAPVNGTTIYGDPAGECDPWYSGSAGCLPHTRTITAAQMYGAVITQPLPAEVAPATGDYVSTSAPEMTPDYTLDPITAPDPATVTTTTLDPARAAIATSPALETAIDTAINTGTDTSVPGTTFTCPTVSVGSPDFTPLTSVDVGDKFPFGFLSWAKNGVTGWGETGTGSAPQFDVPLLGLGADHPIHVDLAIVTPFMALLREAILIVCTIGLIYFMATTFLGFQNWGVGEQGSLF